jgi:hypothetical protein
VTRSTTVTSPPGYGECGVVIRAVQAIGDAFM